MKTKKLTIKNLMTHKEITINVFNNKFNCQYEAYEIGKTTYRKIEKALGPFSPFYHLKPSIIIEEKYDKKKHYFISREEKAS